MYIEKNIDESTQISSFQNATLHSINTFLTCSLSVRPKYPESVKTQEEAVEFLNNALRELEELGWEISAQTGLSAEYEDSGLSELLKHMSKGEILETLYSSEKIKHEMGERWCEDAQKRWQDEDIITSIHNHLGATITNDLSCFDVIRTFYNQHMMFELIGYKTQLDYENAKGESLQQAPYLLLKDLQHEALLEMEDPFKIYEVVKVRSCDGEYSSKVADLADLMDLSVMNF